VKKISSLNLWFPPKNTENIFFLWLGSILPDYRRHLMGMCALSAANANWEIPICSKMHPNIKYVIHIQWSEVACGSPTGKHVMNTSCGNVQNFKWEAWKAESVVRNMKTEWVKIFISIHSLHSLLGESFLFGTESDILINMCRGTLFSQWLLPYNFASFFLSHVSKAWSQNSFVFAYSHIFMITA
jgi:hypothetical protein